MASRGCSGDSGLKLMGRALSLFRAIAHRELESETKETRQGSGTGGNAAREGSRDAFGGRGGRSAVVRH